MHVGAAVATHRDPLRRVLAAAATPPPRDIATAGRWRRPPPWTPNPSPISRLPLLQPILDELGAGGWRISEETAHALGHIVQALKPRLILEFGSGVSTAVFAALCAAAGSGARVVSIEESPAHAAQTEGHLARCGLSRWAQVIGADVRTQRLRDWRGATYAPDAAAMARVMDGERADLVFIDGPASWWPWRRNSRYGALLLAHPWCRDQAVFLIDDAARRRDFAILQRWRALPFVEVLGVIPIGRGLGVGRLRA